MKVLAALLGLFVASVMSQEILEVSCGQDAIVARFNKQTADAANYEMSDLHFNNKDCTFDEEENGYYVKRMEPLADCGTEVVVNETHATFTNSISSGEIDTGLSAPHGIIVGQPENEQLISVAYECTYKIDLRLSTSFIPNITIFLIPIPDAIGTGVFQVAMAIYKDATYFELHSPEGAVPTLQADETVYVGITMVEDTSSDVFIRMRRCWATPGEDPDSEPYYDLIVDSCPVEGAVEGSVSVRQNGVGHQALWQSKVFRFVGEGEEFRSVWLHCDITICIEEQCEPECDARRKRRAIDPDDPPHILTLGPMVFKSHKTEVHYGPEGISHIIIQNNTGNNQPENWFDSRRPQDRDIKQGSSDHTLIIAIGAFAAFCMLCLTMALVIVLARLRNVNRQPRGEVTATGTINKGFSI